MEDCIYKIYDLTCQKYIALFAMEDEATAYVAEHGSDGLQIHLYIDGVLISKTNE